MIVLTISTAKVGEYIHSLSCFSKTGVHKSYDTDYFKCLLLDEVGVGWGGAGFSKKNIFVNQKHGGQIVLRYSISLEPIYT